MPARTQRTKAATGARAAAEQKPRRRTQSERSGLTREKVLQAVVDCIVEEGVSNTTAARIAQRSGVTWGAIVHQFGDKDSVLLAAVERSFEDFSRALTVSGQLAAKSPRERVGMLVDVTWRRLNAPSFRAFLEIVINSRNLSNAELKTRQEDIIVTLTKRVWAELFGDYGIDPATIDTVRKLCSATLLGLAIQGMMGPKKPRFSREIETLKQQVASMLGFEARPGLEVES